MYIYIVLRNHYKTEEGLVKLQGTLPECRLQQTHDLPAMGGLTTVTYRVNLYLLIVQGTISCTGRAQTYDTYLLLRQDTHIRHISPA